MPKKKVLILDDEEDFNMLLKLNMEKPTEYCGNPPTHNGIVVRQRTMSEGRNGKLWGRSMRMMGLGLALALLTGCAVALVGAGAGGTYAYMRGELEREYDASLDQTWAATLQALTALKVQVVDTKKDELGGEIEARRADETKVQVALDSKASNRTLVKIRIGIFGDRDVSERIGREIEKRL
ncbi:MAG: DUF3568 family protein [Candidatus Methylomirabilales bacterium]